MEGNISRQSNFSRSLANDEKLGAYYTNTEMCRRISNLFFFNPEKEYSVIEPSIGDGSAVKAVTGKGDGFNPNIHIFGIELNANTCENVLKEDSDIEYLINEDFLNGVQISNNVFSFCFMNPPYGEDERGDRLEGRFVEKVSSYIKATGYLCMVVPSYILADDKFSRQYLARFSHIAVYRFDDNVYSQFKQVVVIGKKKPTLSLNKELLASFISKVSDITTFPYLPTERVENAFAVPASYPDSIEEFTTREFKADEVYEKMCLQSPIYSSRAIGMKAAVDDYATVELGEPILPPSPSMCYLMATVGGGAGLCGSEGTLHLQRGIADVVTVRNEKVDEDGKITIVETTKTQMSLKVVENDGTISSF